MRRTGVVRRRPHHCLFPRLGLSISRHPFRRCLVSVSPSRPLAGLVASASGRAGGFLLSKPANEISLASIYSAVEDEQMFRMHRESSEPECVVARAILCALMPRLAEASKAMTEQLGTTMLNQIVPVLENNAQAAVA